MILALLSSPQGSARRLSSCLDHHSSTLSLCSSSGQATRSSVDQLLTLLCLTVSKTSNYPVWGINTGVASDAVAINMFMGGLLCKDEGKYDSFRINMLDTMSTRRGGFC